jgi:hypothetical protein
MAKLATCPGCTTQLALPEDATLSDRARCPRCHEEFVLMETVQFSIPTAEILPPLEPETFSPSDTVSPTSYVPASDPYSPVDSDDLSSATSYEPSIESTESAPETALTSEPLPTSATLSDWEARLKRALAGDSDGQSPAKPTHEFSSRALPEAELEESTTYEPQDFSVDDADLTPAAIRKDDWSSADPYQDQEEPTVTFAGDQTVSDDFVVSHFNEEQDIPSPTTNLRKKRKRSLLRTFVSASLGVVGVPLGLYVLLWLRGPAGDMLHIAQYLPSFVLPAEFHEPDLGDSPELLVEESTADTSNATESVKVEQQLTNNEPRSEEGIDAEPLIHKDTAVAPVSAELSTYHGPTFELVDSADFGELLSAAQQAAPLLNVGDLKTKESVASKGQAYMALARLADKGAFLNQPGHSPTDTDKAQAAEQLLESTLRDKIVQRDLPQIALRWWQYTQRPSSGIVLVGEVKRVQSDEAGTLVFVFLGNDPDAPEIPVLLSRDDYRKGEIIGIAGSIESTPQDRLPALDSSLGPVVIAHASFLLDSPHTEPNL